MTGSVVKDKKKLDIVAGQAVGGNVRGAEVCVGSVAQPDGELGDFPLDATGALVAQVGLSQKLAQVALMVLAK